FLKPGDDYSLGGLMVHVNWVLTHYGRMLDAIVAGGFASVGPQDPPGEEAEVREAARRGLEVSERRQSLERMAALHAEVRTALAATSSHGRGVNHDSGETSLAALRTPRSTTPGLPILMTFASRSTSIVCAIVVWCSTKPRRRAWAAPAILPRGEMMSLISRYEAGTPSSLNACTAHASSSA